MIALCRTFCPVRCLGNQISIISEINRFASFSTIVKQRGYACVDITSNQIKTINQPFNRQYSTEQTPPQNDKSNLTSNIDDKLIYTGKLSSVIRFRKLYSLTAPVCGLAFILAATEQSIMLNCGIGIISFAIPFFTYKQHKKHIFDITYNSKTEEYAATTLSVLSTKIQTKFKLNDIVYSEGDVPIIFVGREMIPLSVDFKSFTEKDHYERLMSRKELVSFQSIYTGKYSSQIRRVKIFSLSTSVMGLCAQPLLMEQGITIGGAGLAVVLCSIAGVFTFVTPFLLHYITKKYVINVTYSKETDEYIATTISLLLLKNQTKFKIEDIRIPDIDSMFTSFYVGPKSIPLFVDPHGFLDTHHYARFMGYDKPVDFSIDVNDIKKTNETIKKDN